MTTAEEMIERTARDICVSLDEDPDATHAKYPDWRGWYQYVGAARAACAVAVEMCARIIVDEKQRIDQRIFQHDKTNRITEASVVAFAESRMLEKVGAQIVALATAIKGE